ncbi:MAG: glutamine synthetase family protein [Pseudomonadales bacterium]
MQDVDISNWLKERGIKEVECLVPDMTGNARGKFIPAGKFIKEESRLPEAILAQTVTGEYSDEDFDFISPIDGDMLLVPDAATIRVVPWATEPTAQIIHDCFQPDGSPHPFSTRNVLKKVLAGFTDKGWFPVVAPEMEFYLVAKNINPDMELEAPIGRSGRRESARQSYGIDAANEFENVIDEMYNFCEKQELDVDTLIHESGAAQMEINFLHGNALNLADQVFVFKRTLRESALRQGIYATFMARPHEKEPGSSMHIHQSILDAEGNNIFVDENGEETDLFRWYIGGLQKYIPYVISLFAPNVNSYRRFTKADDAPINLEWGYDNRTAGIRVPHSSAKNRRVENRFAGADANPYLAMAASLGCGLLGIMNKIEPTAAHGGDAGGEEIVISRNLESALQLLDELPEVEAMFGAHFIEGYKAVKSAEFEEFNKVVSAWEREFLLLNV